MAALIGHPIVVSQKVDDENYFTCHGTIESFEGEDQDEEIIYDVLYHNYKVTRTNTKISQLKLNITEVKSVKFDSMASENGVIWSDNGSMIPFAFTHFFDTPNRRGYIDPTDPNHDGSWLNNAFTEEENHANNVSLVKNKLYVARPLIKKGINYAEERVGGMWSVSAVMGLLYLL